MSNSLTYRKYAKQIGKLFWRRVRCISKIHSSGLADWSREYDLVQVTDIRRWSKGPFSYRMRTAAPAKNRECKETYSTLCSSFLDRMSPYIEVVEGVTPPYMGMPVNEACEQERLDRALKK